MRLEAAYTDRDANEWCAGASGLHLMALLERDSGFLHWGARTIKGLARALFRDVLERLKEPIVSPNIYFESIKPSP